MKFNAEMKVVRFGSEDVIATSGVVLKTVTLSGLGDNSANNNKLDFGNYSYTYGQAGVTSSTVRNALGEYVGDPTAFSKTTASNVIFDNGSSTIGLNLIWGGQSNTAGFNGTYVYSSGTTFVLKQ